MNEKAIEALNSVVAYAGTYHAKINNDYGIIRLALTELAEIKRRAEETLTPIIEREEKFKRLYDASTSKTAFITAEEDKFLQNYFYGDGEKDRETKDLIDYILKGETV